MLSIHVIFPYRQANGFNTSPSYRTVYFQISLQFQVRCANYDRIQFLLPLLTRLKWYQIKMNVPTTIPSDSPHPEQHPFISSPPVISQTRICAGLNMDAFLWKGSVKPGHTHPDRYNTVPMARLPSEIKNPSYQDSTLVYRCHETKFQFSTTADC